MKLVVLPGGDQAAAGAAGAAQDAADAHGFAIGGDVSVKRLSLTGSRADIRSATVSEALSELARLLG